MTKVMLVEDDQSLREIYSIRLTAEGYEIVAAGDGEEALAMAVKEKPDLILSDVMMPKISGFDMLDILRSTPETKDIKVMMMTALSSEDQRERGENLGADRYLVKSQVGIEDVINMVHDVLGDKGAVAPTDSSNTAAAPVAEPAQAAQPVAMPTKSATPVPQPAQPIATQPAPDASAKAQPIPEAPATPANPAPAAPAPVAAPAPAGVPNAQPVPPAQ